MIFNIDGKYYISVTTPQTFQAEGDLLFNHFERLVNEGRFKKVEITAVESKNPELLRYKLGRTFRRGFSYGQLSDELLEKLLNDKIIKNIIFEKGKPRVVSESEWEDISISEGQWEDISIS
jgi:hypothetical protein